MVSYITGTINHHSLDIGDFKVYPSDYLSEYTSDYVPHLDITPIKPIDDDVYAQVLNRGN